MKYENVKLLSKRLSVFELGICIGWTKEQLAKSKEVFKLEMEAKGADLKKVTESAEAISQVRQQYLKLSDEWFFKVLLDDWKPWEKSWKSK